MKRRDYRPHKFIIHADPGNLRTRRGNCLFNKRTIAVFSAAFVVVLLAGVALARAGSLAPRAPEPVQVMSGFVAGTEPSSAPTTTLLEVAASVSGEPADPDVSFTAAAGAIPFEITFPQPDARFTEQYVTFRGTAPVGWTVTAAGFAATHDGKGNWSIGLVLTPGPNKATLYATSPDGATVREASVTAHYDVPGPSPSAASGGTGGNEEAVDRRTGAFTANNKYGTVEGKKPRDVYWGTGHPGDTIKVTSPYGSGQTRVGEKGTWDLRVSFSDVPIGETFSVAVQAASGGEASFTFTVLAGDEPPDADHGGQAADHGRRDKDGQASHPGKSGDEGDEHRRGK